MNGLTRLITEIYDLNSNDVYFRSIFNKFGKTEVSIGSAKSILAAMNVVVRTADLEKKFRKVCTTTPSPSRLSYDQTISVLNTYFWIVTVV